jgi:hypothetical protein
MAQAGSIKKREHARAFLSSAMSIESRTPVLHRRNTPSSNVAKKITIKMKNRIFAISVAPLAIPPKPKNAAMIAMMKKMTAYRSMKPSNGVDYRIGLRAGLTPSPP